MKPEYDFSAGKRGPVVKTSPGKTRITIRLNNGVLDWFRKQAHAAGGGNYQSLIDDALTTHVLSHRGVFEDLLRRVVREELEKLEKRRKASTRKRAA